LRESNVYKVWKLPQQPLFRGLEGSLTISPLLSYTMKYTHTYEKAAIARGWKGDD
jgi:hypothetical protein